MRKKGKFYLLVLILLIVFGFFMGRLSIFERGAPEIVSSDVIYSNLRDPILLHVRDDQSELRSVKIVLKRDESDPGLVLMNEEVQDRKDLNLQVNLPKTAYKEKTRSYVLELEVRDRSLWNFFGNKAQKKILVLIDEISPKIDILAHSYHIEKGGAASVVFKSSDENLDEVYILSNQGKIFKVLPYIKEGYYAALVAWDAKIENFETFVVSRDKAGNISKRAINFHPLDRKYRTSNISLSDSFLEGKIQDLAEQYAPKGDNLSLIGKFKFINETLRDVNEDLIRKITSEVREEKFENFNLNLFLPLKNGAKVADFADHRFYSYKGEIVSDSYHMGLDLASVAKAPIINSNRGKVVFASENGIYGLSLILYHGFGVYSLYGHCSSKSVSEGEVVGALSVIANTGTSGLALGDHLHFGVLVQGIETRPEQWQDKRWMENNIYKVLDEAKRIMGENE